MASVGIEDVLYEPVSLVGWQSFHRLQEAWMFCPADGLHLHSVVAVWILNRGRGIDDITRQLVRHEQNCLCKIMWQTLPNPSQRLHISSRLGAAQCISKRHP